MWVGSPPTLQEAGWVGGPVWTSGENLTPTGIRSPDIPARSELLCRLSSAGHTIMQPNLTRFYKPVNNTALLNETSRAV
jgi:hypothetical protein